MSKCQICGHHSEERGADYTIEVNGRTICPSCRIEQLEAIVLQMKRENQNQEKSMPIVNQAAWQKYVEANKDDYGKCCVDVARQVMVILDEE